MSDTMIEITGDGETIGMRGTTGDEMMRDLEEGGRGMRGNRVILLRREDVDFSRFSNCNFLHDMLSFTFARHAMATRVQESMRDEALLAKL